jgi:hypothetical protein
MTRFFPFRRGAHAKPKYKSNSFTRFGLMHFNSARGYDDPFLCQSRPFIDTPGSGC